ncbi:MAG: PAS domain S-box protein [Anaerolineae bacterium]
MKIRNQALLIGGVTLVSVLVVLFIIALVILGDGAVREEDRTVKQDLARTVGLLRYQLGDLDRTVSDWSSWDDTYAFVDDGNPQFVASNVTNATFTNLRLNVLLFVKPSGQVVLAQAFDLQNSNLVPAPPDLLAQIDGTSPLVHFTATTDKTMGVVMLADGPMLVASRPILNSHEQGPLRGAVIFGRYLDKGRVADLQQLIQLPVHVYRYDDATLPAPVSSFSTSTDAAPVFWQHIDEDTFRGYTLVRDIYNRPALVFSLDEVRTDYRQARSALAYLLIALLIVGLALGGAGWFIISRLILARVDDLGKQMRRVGSEEGLAARVSLHGRDELTGLADSINEMLAVRERIHRQQLEGELRYRAVVEQASDGILLVDAQTKQILETNAAYQKLVGYTDQELKRMTLYQVIAQEPESVDRAIAATLSGQQGSFGEHLQQRRSGLPVSVEASLTQLAYGGDRVLCMVVRDITERRWVREALQRNEEYYHSLLDNSLDPIGILNADGIIYYISPAVERVVGGRVEELIGTSVFDYLHPDDLAQARQLFEEGIKVPGQTAQIELRVLDADGSWRIVEAVAKNLIDNPAVVGVVFNFRDMTGRRQIEEALRESELRYRTLVEASTDAIFLETMEGRIVDCNAAACEVYGYSKEELLTLSVPALVLSAAELLPDLVAQLKTSGGFFVEALNRKKDGSLFPCEVSARVVEIEGAQMVIAYCRDVTERKRTEKMQEAVYRIAQAADESETLDDLYAAIHGIVQGVMPANNFYIALYDADQDLLSFPYYRDEQDPALAPRTPGKGLTEYVLKTARSFLCTLDQNLELQQQGEVAVVGAPSLIWLGAPLVIGGRAMGVMAVQHYTDEHAYGPREQQMLEYVSSQVAKAIDRKSQALARARAEQALRDSEERYRRLVESSPDAIAVHSEGRFVFVNAASLRLMGATHPDQLLGKSALEVVHPDYRNVVASRVRLASKEGQESPLIEEKFIRLDGSVVDVEVVAIPFTYQGKPSVQVVVRDITARKRADAALQDKIAALQALAEIDREMLAATDAGAILDLVCRRAADLFHVDRSIIGLFEPGDGSAVAAHGLSRGAETLDALVRLVGREPAQALGLHPLPQDEASIELQTHERVISLAVAPLRAGHRTLGLAAVLDAQPREWTGDELQLLDLLAHQTLLTLEKVRLVSEQQHRADEFAELYALARDLAEEQEITAVLKTVVAHTHNLFGAYAVAIAMYDPVRGDLALEAASARWPMGTRVRMGQGLIGEVAQARQARAIDGKDDAPGPLAPDGARPAAQMAAPIQYGGDLLGVIVASEAGTTRRFTEADLRLLSLFAAQAASAVHNAQLFRETRVRAQQLALVYEAGLAVNRVLEPRAQLELLFQKAMQALHADRAEFFRYDRRRNRLYCELSIGYAPEIAERMSSALSFSLDDDTNIIAQPARTLKPLNVADLARDPRWLALDPETRSGLWAPVEHENRLTGLLCVLATRPAAFDADDERLLMLFANQAAVAMETARLFEETRRRAEHLALLNHIANAASQSLDLDELLENIYLEVGRLLHPEAFFIALYDSKADELEYRIRVDQGVRDATERKPLRETILTAQLITGRQPLLIHDLEEERAQYPRPSLWGSMRPARSWLGVPMQIGDAVLGVISLQTYTPNSFTEEDARLLMTIADHAALAIEKARLSHETQRRLAELEAVNRISGALRAAQTREEMLPLLLDTALAVMESTAGQLALYDPTNQEMRVAVARGWFTAMPAVTLLDQGLGGLAFQTQQVQVAREFHSEPRLLEETRLRTPPGWGGAVVPIRAAHEPIGILRIAVPLPREIKPDEAHLLTTIAEIGGNAIHRATLFEQTERRIQRLAALQTMGMAISASLDLRITLDILLDQVVSQLGVDAVDVLLLHSQTHLLEYAAGRGFRSPMPQRSQLRLGEGGGGRAALERRVIHIPDLARESAALLRTQVLPSEAFVSYYGVPLMAKGQVKGVLEIFHRSEFRADEEWSNFLQALAGEAAIALADAQLFEDLQRSNLELALAYDATIEGWARALEMREQALRGHTQRVVEMTLRLARRLGIGAAQMIHIRRGALLHDIGKMAIPDQVLFNTGPLTPEEWTVMHQHPLYAYTMLSPISYLRPALDIPYAHHERWDGQGYPRGLQAEQIPIAARIFAVVDAWDALSSERPYRAPWTRDQIADYLQKETGHAFDPHVVSEFLKLLQSEEEGRSESTEGD